MQVQVHFVILMDVLVLCWSSQFLGHVGSSTVILVCDLVYGSVAEQDGRLKKGDLLVCIGDVNVIGQPVSFAVNMLKATRSGPVVLKVRHALHCSLLEEEEDVRFFLKCVSPLMHLTVQW